MKEIDELDDYSRAADIPAPSAEGTTLQAGGERPHPATDKYAERLARWERFRAHVSANSIHSGGERYSRDELHERR